MNPSNPIRILIVEDFHAETEALLLELRDAEMAYEKSVVRNEKQYTEQLALFKPDVILSPYSLKGTNAIKLLGIARKSDVDVPFILLAFDLSEDIAIDLLGEGIEDYVQQSTLKRLPVAIKKALQRYKTQLELRISESRIKTSEESLRNMVRNAPIAMAMFDLGMNYLVVSDIWLKHEGKKEEELIGKNHYLVVPEIPDHWRKIHLEVLAGKTHEAENETMLRSDGTNEVLRWKMNPWYTSEGAVGGAVLFIEDITTTIEATTRIERNEHLLAIGEELGNSGSFEFDLVSQTPRWSKNMYRIKGFEPGQDISHENYIKHIHPDDLESYNEAYSKIMDSVAPSLFEYRLIRPKDGKVVYMRVHSTFINNNKGEPTALMGSVQDVTHIRIAEEALLQSESSLKRAQKIAKTGSWALSSIDNSVKWSEELYSIHGLEGQTPTYDLIRSLTHPEDIHLFDNGFKDLSNGINTDFVYRIVTPAGEVKHVRGVGHVLKDKNEAGASMSGTVQDVSKETAIRLELENTQKSLEVAQSIAKVGSWEWAKGEKSVDVSSEMFSIYETKKKSLTIDDIRSFIHPDDKKRVSEEAANDFNKNIKPVIEYRILTEKGNLKYVVTSAKQIVNEDGEVTRLIGTIQDVSERLAFKEALGEKERLLSEMAESINEVFWVTNLSGEEVVYMSNRYEDMYGMSMESIYEDGTSWSENIHPEDKPKVFKSWEENRLNGKFDVEYRLIHPSGKIKWLHVKAFPILDEVGKPVRIAGITRDITTKQKYKEQIETLSLVASETVNGVLIQDASGKIEWSNKGFTKITGYSGKEVVGKKPWSFLSGEETSIKLTELTLEKVNKGKAFTTENTLYTKEGKPVWISLAVSPILDNAGKLSRMVAIATDISKQKELEELQRNMLTRMETRVAERTSELESKNVELRNEIWENQRISDELYHHNLDLKDSIDYAKRIQESILPDVKELQKSFAHGFILFLPRDVVSGDFYWYYKRDNLSYFAAIDCTGHGVPGALMSMIANELMNQAVIQKKLTDPGEILTSLNKLMIRTLRQKQENRMRDGMDLSLIVIDHSSDSLKFSGALSSIYIAHKGDLVCYSGSRHSVGGHLEDVTKSFETQQIDLKKGSTIYLSTDGYMDQFGGPDGKKLMKKRFAKFLESIQNLPFDEQENALHTKFKEWKGSLNQVDDVLVTGLSY